MSADKIETLVLIDRAKAGDQKAVEKLLADLDYDIRYAAHIYYVRGYDREDCMQMARIGAWKAIKYFRTDRGQTWRSFAIMCIYRYIFTQIILAGRQKNRP